jgi:hypothetical protein
LTSQASTKLSRQVAAESKARTALVTVDVKSPNPM